MECLLPLAERLQFLRHRRASRVGLSGDERYRGGDDPGHRLYSRCRLDQFGDGAVFLVTRKPGDIVDDGTVGELLSSLSRDRYFKTCVNMGKSLGNRVDQKRSKGTDLVGLAFDA